MHNSNTKNQLAVFVFLILAGSFPAWGKVIYVDADASGANDGTSWENAYFYLQDALMFAVGGDEIRAAQGVYKPDDFVLSDRPSRGREETFQLINGVALKGGYAGFGQPDPNARDIELYETILSGDLDGNDVDVESALDLWHDPNRAENSYHVVTSSGTDETAVLDGLTITGGNANGSRLQEKDRGGGMYILDAAPNIIGCTFIKNSASYTGGGGIYSYQSTLAIRGCIFRRNIASFAGGGMFATSASANLHECAFTENVARPVSTSGGVRGHYGGAIYASSSSLILIGCTLTKNSTFVGGAIANRESILDLHNCLLEVNISSSNGGGAIAQFENGLSELKNCTFAGNIGESANAVQNLWDCFPCIVNARDCIFADGEKEIGTPDINDVFVSYCNVEGGWLGEGNINIDPCFANSGHWEDPCDTPENRWDDVWIDGDYHLKSQAGRWDANEGRWAIDDLTSPCIDAGDPMSPIGLEPFPNGGIVNMGAYGGTTEASKSYFGGPVCETIVAGDVNGDCLIDFKDFYLLALHWLEDHNP